MIGAWRGIFPAHKSQKLTIKTITIMTAKQAFEALERAAATTTFAGVKNIKMRRPWYIVREALPCYYYFGRGSSTGNKITMTNVEF